MSEELKNNKSNEEFHAPEDEVSELEQQFEARMNNTRERMSALFDEAVQKGLTPAQLMLEDDFSLAEEIFGTDRINDFKEALSALRFEGKDEFIASIVNLLEPFNHDRIFDSEVKARAEAVEQRFKSETIKTGFLESKIHPSDWAFTTSDGIEVKVNDDMVLEISLPEEGEKPKGINKLRETFNEIAAILRGRPHIKAVTGVSWMMSRGITDKLGFEKYPDLPIPKDQVDTILGMATSARSDKNYSKDVKPADVMVGAMSREQFLKKYG